MKRALEVKSVGQWNPAAAIDRVELDAGDRHRRRVVLVGERGATYLLDLAKPAQLRDGDGLVLEDGKIVRVAGKIEPLVEIAAESPQALARIAWHIGNRHTDIQVIGDRLRIRRDPVIEEMLHGLRATLTPIEAPFDPEGGAYHVHPHGDQV
jgi:urease accessory protein